jgi:hypothetical protein
LSKFDQKPFIRVTLDQIEEDADFEDPESLTVAQLQMQNTRLMKQLEKQTELFEQYIAVAKRSSEFQDDQSNLIQDTTSVKTELKQRRSPFRNSRRPSKQTDPFSQPNTLPSHLQTLNTVPSELNLHLLEQ